jgi:hypothetical protein
VKVGDRVIFGRPNGQKTLGVVEKINPRRVKVRTLEERGSGVAGVLWSVAPSLLSPAPFNLADEIENAHRAVIEARVVLAAATRNYEELTRAGKASA